MRKEVRAPNNTAILHSVPCGGWVACSFRTQDLLYIPCTIAACTNEFLKRKLTRALPPCFSRSHRNFPRKYQEMTVQTYSI